MIKIKSVILLGGTGFVGRAIAEEYLNNGWRVIIPTRATSFNRAGEKLINHGFDRQSLERYINSSLLIFSLSTDLSDKKWTQINTWLNLFRELNLNNLYILRIINFVGETSKSSEEILKSNLETLNSIFTLVKYFKSINKDVIFCNMGSTAEKKLGRYVSSYEKAKKLAQLRIEESGLCDYHFVANYIKGKGEQKMRLVAPYLWKRLRYSHKWLFGFKVSIINVDDLAEIIYIILEKIKIIPQNQKTIEVNINNGELLFGEMIRNLLPENKRKVPKAIIPIWFEKYFLQFYAFVAPRIQPNNQMVRRLSNFAKKGSMGFSEQEKFRVFKTSKEVKYLAGDEINFRVLERDPILIIQNKLHPIVYALLERSEEEIKQFIQK